jgi:hypothetical protein
LGCIAEHVFGLLDFGAGRRRRRWKTLDLSAAARLIWRAACVRGSVPSAGMLMKSLHEIPALPFTLQIIPDQAEEVITLGDATPEYRRQFFRFAWNSADQLPIKLVLALRKDHPLLHRAAQEGGPSTCTGAERRRVGRATEQRAAPSRRRQAFLLCEFSEKWHIAADPKDPLDDLGAPFEQYGFEYAGRGRDRQGPRYAVHAAVLPVMQIACRSDKNARPPPGEASAVSPRVIGMTQYVEGGRIGPVDRHISKSLREPCAAEGRRPRRGGAPMARDPSGCAARVDGTVHTHRQPWSCAPSRPRKRGGKRRPCDRAPRSRRFCCARSRSVRRGRRQTRRLSLGHDFIAMVLQRWKSGEQEAQLARERIAKITRRAILTGVSVAGAIAVIAFFTVVATNAGKTIQTHEVLLNTVKASQRDAPRLAMLASAHAMTVSEEMKRYLFWKKGQQRRSAPCGPACGASRNEVLGHGFDNGDGAGGFHDQDLRPEVRRIRGRRRRCRADGDRASDKPFKLRPFGAARRDFAYRPQSVVSESRSGAVLLLRASSASPVRELSSSKSGVRRSAGKGQAARSVRRRLLPEKAQPDAGGDAVSRTRRRNRRRANAGSELQAAGPQWRCSRAFHVDAQRRRQRDVPRRHVRIQRRASADDPFVHNFKLEHRDRRTRSRKGRAAPGAVLR